MNPASGRHQPADQRIFDRRRIAAEIVAGDDVRPHAHLADQRAEAHAERLNAHQVDFLFEQPARVVFAKAGRLDHRLRFIGVGVGRQTRASASGTSRPRAGLEGRQHIACAPPGKHPATRAASHLRLCGTGIGAAARRRAPITARARACPTRYCQSTADRNDMPSRFCDSASSGSTIAATLRTKDRRPRRGQARSARPDDAVRGRHPRRVIPLRPDEARAAPLRFHAAQSPMRRYRPGRRCAGPRSCRRSRNWPFWPRGDRYRRAVGGLGRGFRQ